MGNLQIYTIEIPNKTKIMAYSLVTVGQGAENLLL